MKKISLKYLEWKVDFCRNFTNKKFLDLWKAKEPVLFIVNLHPEKTYFPKISSRVKEDGRMESNPLHIMTPELDKITQNKLDIFLNKV